MIKIFNIQCCESITLQRWATKCFLRRLNATAIAVIISAMQLFCACILNYRINMISCKNSSGKDIEKT